MHELSVVRSLIESVKEHTPDSSKRVLKGIVIEVGRLTCVDTERLMFCFTMVQEESGLADVQLRIEPVNATVKCSQCGDEHQISRLGEACRCGSYQHQVLTGNELNLIQIEYC
ncbi:hydrogenase maturation nickel metallochaperone HypA [Aliiglaciecola sp.]|nr:hydrogenase maturation nickel metallochaperone HypA [Aliiglaciecola sp.]